MKDIILKHWSGGNSLVKAYWLVWFLGQLPIALLSKWAETSLPEGDFLWIPLAIASLAYLIWAGVGLFRSAGNYIAENKKYFWAVVVYIILTLNVLMLCALIIKDL
jgi:hypothetical protein|tara:strand:- start:61 stop:378 length:318 start_codon:yes stop_codon:yes gene_type:complete